MDNARASEIRQSTPMQRTTVILTFLFTIVVIVQSAGGLLMKGLYRDNRWVTSIFQGTDFVTLILVVPTLLASLAFAARGSFRGRLILAGAAYYVFYNNMYYLFSSYNNFFLVYVALFILALAVLTQVLCELMGTVVKPLARTVWTRAASVSMFSCAAILSLMWTGQTVVFMMNGQIPQLIIDSGSNTHVVAALDLTLEVPPLVLAAVMLWRVRPLGGVFSAIVAVECIIVTINLVITPVFQEAAGIADAWTMVPLWAAMLAAFLVPAVHVLRNIRIHA
jgi:hypothetical protein